MKSTRRTVEMNPVQIGAARRLLEDRAEFEELGAGEEPAPLRILLDADDDEWEEEVSFADALGYLAYPAKLWDFCAETSTDVAAMEDRISWAVEQWRSQYSEAELSKFVARQERLSWERADVAEALLHLGERLLELDVLTVIELERRGWVDVEGFEPLPPDAGESELLNAFS